MIKCEQEKKYGKRPKDLFPTSNNNSHHNNSDKITTVELKSDLGSEARKRVQW
jgi:hypothetical protein